MKKAIQILINGFCIMAMHACDSGFDEMNINPIALTTVNPAYQLNTTIVNSAPVYGNLSYETTIVKQMITPFSGQGSAANFNQDNRGVTSGNWNTYYRTIIKELADVAAKTKDDADRTNLYNMARIWKAYAFMILSDTYGNIPYAEAGAGFLTGNTTPAYDNQEAIYNDILTELDAASNALDASKAAVSSDVLYGGDISKWKKLGNSLLLRAAMRLSKVNPAKAAEYVSKAVAGGLMQSNQDNAVIRHTASFTNPVGSSLNGGQSAFYYLDDEFVAYLSANNDPAPRVHRRTLRRCAKRGRSGGNEGEPVGSRADRHAAGLRQYDHQRRCSGQEIGQFMGLQPARQDADGGINSAQFPGNLCPNAVSAGRGGGPQMGRGRRRGPVCRGN
jgi:hypothetical protein